MIVFRLCKSMFKDDLSGRGAEITGGRWNRRGNPMLYTAENRALCTAEIAVHTPLGIIPQDYMLLSIEVPDELNILEYAPDTLPEDWRLFPHPISTKRLGDQFLSERHAAIMRVPSAIVGGEFNILVNPLHPQSEKIKLVDVEPFVFDKRLFVR
ncbi:MAG: RES family NAD+ phosphorylase [Bacteroidetes bacterium]|nr:RES family NAD+ phosphorylase [Bacteroidota bacterium]